MENFESDSLGIETTSLAEAISKGLIVSKGKRESVKMHSRILQWKWQLPTLTFLVAHMLQRQARLKEHAKPPENKNKDNATSTRETKCSSNSSSSRPYIPRSRLLYSYFWQSKLTPRATAGCSARREVGQLNYSDQGSI